MGISITGKSNVELEPVIFEIIRLFSQHDITQGEVNVIFDSVNVLLAEQKITLPPLFLHK